MNNFHNSEAYASFFCANFHQKSPPGRIPTGRRFHLVLIGFPPPLDKLKFGGPMPSPLGKVDRRRRDGRGRYRVACPYAFRRNRRNLFRPRLRSATFPKGEGIGPSDSNLPPSCFRQITFNFQFFLTVPGRQTNNPQPVPRLHRRRVSTGRNKARPWAGRRGRTWRR